MTSSVREEKLNTLLTNCEKLYRRPLHIVPDPGATDLSIILEENKRLAATVTDFILEGLREADLILRDAALEGSAQDIAPKAREFYQETLLPKRGQLETLLVDLLDLPNVEIDFDQIRPDPERAPVWNILVSGLDYWNQDESGAFAPEDLEDADQPSSLLGALSTR